MTAPTLADEIAALKDAIISGERTALKYGPMSALYEHNQNCLRSALARLEAMQWRPIGTAPKDAWFVGWSLPHGASRCRWNTFGYQTELFIAQEKYRGYAEGYPPTHWQPLPLPPEPQEGER